MASFLDRILSHGSKTKVLTQEQAARSVVVSNVAPQTADEAIVIHFQKRKNGGGEIDHVHIPNKGTAVITFESSEGLSKFCLGVLQESNTAKFHSEQLGKDEIFGEAFLKYFRLSYGPGGAPI